MTLPSIGDTWGGSYRVRLGRREDAAAIARWRARSSASPIRWALDEAARTVEHGSASTAVYTIINAEPVGVLTIATLRPYLQLVYIDDAHRQSGVATRATSVLIDHYFRYRGKEPWIGVVQPIAPPGVRLLRRLGFWELEAGMQLTRASWTAQLPSLLDRFGDAA